jgi:hypothetical protein
VFNRGDAPASVTVLLYDLADNSHNSWAVRDLWARHDLDAATQTLTVDVPGHGVRPVDPCVTFRSIFCGLCSGTLPDRAIAPWEGRACGRTPPLRVLFEQQTNSDGQTLTILSGC